MNPAHVRNPFAWASASADSTYVIELRHLAVITLIIGTLMALVLLYVLHERRNAQRALQHEIDLAISKTITLAGQPHVIFNSLTAIEELCDEDPSKARRIIADFSAYLRGNLSVFGNDQTVPLIDEVAFCKSYIKLEQLDPTETIHVDWRLEEQAFRIPPMSLQTVIEYMLLYGRTSKSGLHLTVSSWKERQYWYVQVMSDAPCTRLKDDRQAIIDLSNVRERMRMLCGGDLVVQRDADHAMLMLTIAQRTGQPNRITPVRPLSSTRPSCSTTMRSAICRTTPRSCETIINAMSGSACRIRRKESRIRILAATSMALIGSSASRIRG